MYFVVDAVIFCRLNQVQGVSFLWWLLCFIYSTFSICWEILLLIPLLTGYLKGFFCYNMRCFILCLKSNRRHELPFQDWSNNLQVLSFSGSAFPHSATWIIYPFCQLFQFDVLVFCTLLPIKSKHYAFIISALTIFFQFSGCIWK